MYLPSEFSFTSTSRNRIYLLDYHPRNMNLVLNIIFLVILEISIVHAESSEVKDVRSLIGKLSRENHLSHPSCNCEARGLSKPRHVLRGQSSMCAEEERRQSLNDAIERLKQFLALFGHVDNYLTQKTNGLIRVVGKAVESELKDSEKEEDDDDDYEAPKQLYRKNMRKYWPYVYAPPPQTVITTTLPE